MELSNLLSTGFPPCVPPKSWLVSLLFEKVDNMTDTTVVSTLTNNSVSFDISGLRHFEEGDKIWFCLVDIGRMLEMNDSAVRVMKTREWFDSDEINTVTNCKGGSDITYVSESAPNFGVSEFFCWQTGLIRP